MRLNHYSVISEIQSTTYKFLGQHNDSSVWVNFLLSLGKILSLRIQDTESQIIVNETTETIWCNKVKYERYMEKILTMVPKVKQHGYKDEINKIKSYTICKYCIPQHQ